MKINLFFAPIVISLAACGGGEPVASGFRTPSASGSITEGLTQDRSATVRSSRYSSNGFAYSVGDTNGDGFAAYSGVLPTTNVGSQVSSGTVNLSGRYEVAYIDNITLNSNLLTGRSYVDYGAFSATADFNNNTFTGSNSSRTFRVSGAISGQAISGTSVMDGVTGEMTGVIGTRGAVGAVHGSSSSFIYAGGFYAE